MEGPDFVYMEAGVRPLGPRRSGRGRVMGTWSGGSRGLGICKPQVEAKSGFVVWTPNRVSRVLEGARPRPASALSLPTLPPGPPSLPLPPLLSSESLHPQPYPQDPLSRPTPGGGWAASTDTGQRSSRRARGSSGLGALFCPGKGISKGQRGFSDTEEELEGARGDLTQPGHQGQGFKVWQVRGSGERARKEERSF